MANENELIISTSSVQTLMINYRLPNGQVNSLVLPSRTINYKKVFSSTDMKEAFMKSAQPYIDSKIITIGKATEKQLSATEKEIDSETRAKVEEKSNSQVEQILGSAEKSGGSVETTTEKLSEEKTEKKGFFGK